MSTGPTGPESGLYERVLAAAGGRLPAARPARPSAAVVLWRDRAGSLEVFWIRRGRTLPFMGGWHAFPGGGVERSDAGVVLNGDPRHPDPEQATPPAPDAVPPFDPDLAPGVVACALRELDEETGVRLDAGRLVFAGRWLTPPFGAARFDNRFFLAEWRTGDAEPAARPPENESGEWIEPARALEVVAAGEAIAAPPILHLLHNLAESGPEGALPRLLDTGEANLGPLRRIELRPGILIFPLAAATLPPASHTNAFLLGGGEAILVDPGSPFEDENAGLIGALEAARTKLGRRVVEIWLTHHHPDHVAGVERLRRALDVPVAAHRATAERLAAVGIGVDRELAGGEIRHLAGDPALELRLHHTPGHARGHLAIEVRPGPHLVGGDLVAAFGTIVVDPPEGDMDDYLASLESMRGRGFRTLFPSHGAPILEVDDKLADYIAHRLAREQQVLDCWRSGTRAPAAMIPVVYPEVPEAVHPLAERQIRAHLDRLERSGRLAEPGAAR